MGIEDALARRIAAHPVVRRVVLFGSRAKGTARERSDVDLAIEAPTARQWLDLLEDLDGAETLLSIDAVRLDEASPALRARVAAEGRLLFERGE